MANQVQNPEARAMLEAAGLTPAQLRILTGVTPNAMSRWWSAGIPKYAQTIIDQHAGIARLIEALSECADLYESTLIASGAKPEMAALHAERFRALCHHRSEK